MILVKLSGGLGNQMFQYAFGKYLAVKNNTNLALDTSFLQSKLPLKKFATQMKYELGIFDINATLKQNIISSNVVLYPFSKLEYFLRTKYYDSKYHVLSENDFSFNADYLIIENNSYIKGNFQSEKYFKNIENVIRKDFIFQKDLDAVNLQLKQQIESSNAVSIHVRRGDYISIKRNASKFASVPLDYYNNAIKLIADKIPTPSFFIFSDDIAWTKENLKINYPAFFINNNNTAITAYKDMQLMSLCKHNIIANSTFSWWSAWLNNHPDKIVIAPQKWFEDSSINSKDIYPKEWIKL